MKSAIQKLLAHKNSVAAHSTSDAAGQDAEKRFSPCRAMVAGRTTPSRRVPLFPVAFGSAAKSRLRNEEPSPYPLPEYRERGRGSLSVSTGRGEEIAASRENRKTLSLFPA